MTKHYGTARSLAPAGGTFGLEANVGGYEQEAIALRNQHIFIAIASNPVVFNFANFADQLDV